MNSNFEIRSLSLVLIMSIIAGIIVSIVNANDEKKNTDKEIQSVIQSTGIVFYKLNFENMNYEYMSPSIVSLCGYTVEELNKYKFSSIIKKIETHVSDEVDLEIIKKQRIELQNNSENLVFDYNKDYLIQTKSGEKIYINDKSKILLNEESKAVGSVGILTNINERKLSEKIQKTLFKISESAYSSENIFSFYKKLYEIITETISANNFFVALYNDEKNRYDFPIVIQNKKEVQMLPNGLDIFCHTITNEAGGKFISSENYKNIYSDMQEELKEKLPTDWLSFPITLNKNQNSFLAVYEYSKENFYSKNENYFFNKISKQISFSIDKKLEDEAIIKYTDELKQLNANKDKFFSIIAHDLRSPFTGLLGLSDILAEDWDSLSDSDIKKFINNIRKLTKDLFKMINDLLHWSRIQTGRIEFNLTHLNLLEEILNVKNLLNPKAELKEISILNNLDYELSVYADQMVVRSVLENLISNAIKFSYRGNKIIISAVEEDKYVKVSVKDFGIGIPSADIENLFKIEKQTSTVGTENEKGTGLGLIICYELLKKINCSIWAESNKNELEKNETTFSFSLQKFQS